MINKEQYNQFKDLYNLYLEICNKVTDRLIENGVLSEEDKIENYTFDTFNDEIIFSGYYEDEDEYFRFYFPTNILLMTDDELYEYVDKQDKDSLI